MKRSFLQVMESGYAYVFSRPGLRKLNRLLLRLTMKAEGFNNYRTFRSSGERFFVEKILGPFNPRVCVDIGAHAGAYTRMLLENTAAFVYSFEPLPGPFTQLNEKTQTYATRVETVDKGVGDADGFREIYFNDRDLEQASFSREIRHVPYVENEQCRMVEMVTLDTFFSGESPECLDFLKIDAEGFEKEVIRGAAVTIERYKPVFIQIEFNWHQLFRRTTLHDFACMLPGYEVYQLLPGGWVKRDPRDPFVNFYHYSNFVFARVDRQDMHL